MEVFLALIVGDVIAMERLRLINKGFAWFFDKYIKSVVGGV